MADSEILWSIAHQGLAAAKVLAAIVELERDRARADLAAARAEVDQARDLAARVTEQAARLRAALEELVRRAGDLDIKADTVGAAIMLNAALKDARAALAREAGNG